MDDNLCADYAISFLCGCDVEEAGHRLWRAGRGVMQDGATDAEIAQAIKSLGFRMRVAKPPGKTIRTCVAGLSDSRYLITTTDHVLAFIGGRVCDRPEYGDLMRVEKIHEILFDF